MDLYKQLFEIKKNCFDLTEGGGCCGFKYEKDMSVRYCQGNEFNRCIRSSSEFERVEVF